MCDKVIQEKIPFVVEEKVGNVVIEEETACAEGENNDITFVFKNTLEEDVDLKCEGITCPVESHCSNGICLCLMGEEVCGTICCPANQMCSSAEGGCEEVAGECINNTDCNSDQYCQISASSASSETSCFNNYKGTCVSLGISPNAVKTEGLGKVYKSSGGMSWWSARNWCEDHGKRLLDMRNNRLDCYQNDGKTPFGDTTLGALLRDGANFVWNGQSVTMQTLRNQFVGQYIWTRVTKSACQVLHLDLWGGQVKVVNRATGYYGAALCE